MTEAPSTSPSWRAFERLMARRIARSPGVRFATLASVFITVLTLILMLMVRAGPRGDLDGIAVRGLGWASWLVVLPATLGAIGVLAELRRTGAALAAIQRLGLLTTRVELALLAASCRVVATRLGLAGGSALLLALALSRELAELPRRALQLLAGSGYILGLSLTAALVALGTSSLGARRGRWLLLLFLVVPMIASERWLGVVDVERLLERLLERIFELGAR